MSAHDVVIAASLTGLLALVMRIGGLPAVRARIGREAARKGVHAAMGVTAALLPLWFDALAPVLATSAAMALWLLAVRTMPTLGQRFGAILDAPGRRSVGDLAFAVAVPIAFWRTGGAWVPYAAALLLLAGADTAAALVGRRSPGPRYVGPGRGKSPAGTAAFLVAGMAVVTTVLGVVGHVLLASAIELAVPVVLVAAVLELASPRGLDNLTIPLSAVALLTPGWAAEHAELLGVVAGLVLAVATLGAREPARPVAATVRGGAA